MIGRCVLTAAAERDLEDIADFIARFNPVRALSFTLELRQRCLEIASLPDAWPSRAEIGDGVRVVPHGSYLILYAHRTDIIVIERIVHGARNLTAIF